MFLFEVFEDFKQGPDDCNSAQKTTSGRVEKFINVVHFDFLRLMIKKHCFSTIHAVRR
jgi:hypothetical protein